MNLVCRPKKKSLSENTASNALYTYLNDPLYLTVRLNLATLYSPQNAQNIPNYNINITIFNLTKHITLKQQMNSSTIHTLTIPNKYYLVKNIHKVTL